MLPRLARSNALLMARAAPMIALGESATLMDAGLRPLRERAHGRLRDAFGAIADRLDREGMLRIDPRTAADTLDALSNETSYLRMDRPPEEYARCLADTLP